LTHSPLLPLICCSVYHFLIFYPPEQSLSDFFVTLSGDIHVCCADFLCWNQVFVANKLCLLQKFTTLSPLSFRTPTPKGPIVSSSLFSPTLPLKSPITITHSLPFLYSFMTLSNLS